MELISTEVISDWGGNVIPDKPPEDGDIVRYTYRRNDGKIGIREKIYHVIVPIPEPVRVYIHVDLSKTKVANNGIDTVQVTFTLRAGVDPTSAVKTGINRTWETLFRDQDNVVYDTIIVQFTNGIATFDYKPSGKSVAISMKKADVDTVISNAVVTLVTEPHIQILSDYTGA